MSAHVYKRVLFNAWIASAAAGVKYHDSWCNIALCWLNCATPYKQIFFMDVFGSVGDNFSAVCAYLLFHAFRAHVCLS